VTTIPEFSAEVRIVRFTTVVSLIVVTLEIPSRPHRIPECEPAWRWGFPYSLLSIAFGWWALPWGPLRTWEALKSNRCGLPVDAETIP